MSLLHLDAGRRELAVARIVVFALAFSFVLRTDVSLYEGIPEAIVYPTGLVSLLPVEALLASTGALVVLKVLTLVGCVACVVGLRPFTPIAVTTAVLLLVHDGLMKSVGLYTNHAETAMVITALVIALFPAADALSPRHRPARPVDQASTREPQWRYVTPLLASAGLIALSYAFIGMRRIAEGGVGIYLDDSMVVWSVGRSLAHTPYDQWDFGLALLDHSWLVPLVALGYGVATIMEVLSPLALRYRVLRWCWLAVIVPLHVLTLVTMKIFFLENIVLVLLFFAVLPWLARRASPDDVGERVEAG